MINNQEIEGSSDSESEGEDFSKEESNNLFTQIMKRNNPSGYGYVIREKKKNRNVRLNYMNGNGNNSNNGNKKKDNEEDDTENINRGGEIGENKKFKSARMI